MPTNDFLPFAINTDAGVMSQVDYAARAGLGVVPGLADPDFANKAWRQSSVMAAMLGRVIAGEGLNALDNGEVDALKNNFLDALAARVLLKMQAINSAGGLEYRTDHDYVPGSIVLQSGIKYICLTSNGPSSTVKSPASDTTKTYWAAVVSMADVSSTGGAGKIPIATNEGYLKAGTPDNADNSQNVATTAFVNSRLPYIKGTWTPVLKGATTAGEFSYSTRYGYYTRIGNLVFIQMGIIATCTEAPTGYVRITELPFLNSVSAYLMGINQCGGLVTSGNNYNYGTVIRMNVDTGLWAYLKFSQTDNTGDNFKCVVGSSASFYISGVYKID